MALGVKMFRIYYKNELMIIEIDNIIVYTMEIKWNEN